MKEQAVAGLRVAMTVMRQALDGERDESLEKPLADLLAAISIVANTHGFNLDAMNARRKQVMEQFERDHGK